MALETTPVSVDSALQRAHRTVDRRLPEQSQQVTLRSLGDDALRGVARRYITAWERNGQRRQAGRARTCRYHRQAIRR